MVKFSRGRERRRQAMMRKGQKGMGGMGGWGGGWLSGVVDWSVTCVVDKWPAPSMMTMVNRWDGRR